MYNIVVDSSRGRSLTGNEYGGEAFGKNKVFTGGSAGRVAALFVCVYFKKPTITLGYVATCCFDHQVPTVAIRDFCDADGGACECQC